MLFGMVVILAGLVLHLGVAEHIGQFLINQSLRLVLDALSVVVLGSLALFVIIGRTVLDMILVVLFAFAMRSFWRLPRIAILAVFIIRGLLSFLVEFDNGLHAPFALVVDIKSRGKLRILHCYWSAGVMLFILILVNS